MSCAIKILYWDGYKLLISGWRDVPTDLLKFYSGRHGSAGDAIFHAIKVLYSAPSRTLLALSNS